MSWSSARDAARRLGGRLVEPGPAAISPEDRHASRLVAMILALLLGIDLIALVAWLVAPGAYVAGTEAVVTGASLPFLVASYVLARQGRPRGAAWIALIAMSVAVYVLQVTALVGLNPLYKPDDAAALMFLALPVIVAGAILSRRATVLIAAVEALLVLTVPLFDPVVRYSNLLTGPAALVIVVSALMVSFANYREQLERDRTDRLLAEIAERRRAEEELGRHRDALEALVEERTADLELAMTRLVEANEAKDRFLAGMSHELRTPLNSIIGFTSVLRQGMAGPVTEEQARQLSMVERSSRHLLALIEQVLDLSRIAAGLETVRVEAFEVPDLVNDVRDVMEPLATEKGLTLTSMHYLDGAAGTIRTDRGKLRQILLNLVGNAVKFTDEGGIELVAVRSGDTFTVTVSDTGIGILSEELETIFDEYLQVTAPGSVKPPGTGLGLTVSRRLARLLGGDLTVESERGEGSRFSVTLPASWGEAPADGPASVRSRRSAGRDRP